VVYVHGEESGRGWPIDGLTVEQATDVIGEAAFGDSFRMLETGKVRPLKLHATT